MTHVKRRYRFCWFIGFGVVCLLTVHCDGSNETNADAGASDASSDSSSIGDGGDFTEQCEDGPLDAPIEGCTPVRTASSGDPLQDCVDRINQLRWECQCLPPLQRWTDGEDCAQEQAKYDITHGAHAGFSAQVCSPRGFGQNECPGYGSVDAVLDGCLQQMWNEGPGEPFPEHGHYINMTNEAYIEVACGFAQTEDGVVWAVQNFN